MNFVSPEFIIFLAVTWVLFALVPRHRVFILLAASYIFYATWSVPFIGIILLTTSIDYAASRFLAAEHSKLARKAVFLAALTANLFVLAFFKYANVLLDAHNNLLSMLGLHSALPEHLNIILPLGISYYTFEAIGYLVDCYRGGQPARSWLQYNFYIMYFPHLISGPIIRFNELWDQYKNGLSLPNQQTVFRAFELLVLGYFFKVVIANSCAEVADPIFNNIHGTSALAAWIGALAFTTQVYFDFMGYTHIARGASLLFNVELPLNFRHPFNAGNISDFWQRWQISLTRWIRDYIFIPLGGSRLGYARTLLNVFIIMFVCGVWHGAGHRYVVWGAYYGVLLVAYTIYKSVRPMVLKSAEERTLSHPCYSIASTISTYLCVVIACIIFRAHEVGDAIVMIGKTMRFSSVAKEFQQILVAGEYDKIALLVVLLTCCFAGPLVQRVYQQAMLRLPFIFKVNLAACASTICWIISGTGMTPFIYFEF